MNDFVTEIVNAINSKKSDPVDTTATVVRVDDDTAYVHIDGGVEETPVEMTISCKVDDVVKIRINNGKAYIIGNVTNPPTDDSYAQFAFAEIKKLVANTIIAGVIKFDELIGNRFKVTKDGKLYAKDATIEGKIKATSLELSSETAEEAGLATQDDIPTITKTDNEDGSQTITITDGETETKYTATTYEDGHYMIVNKDVGEQDESHESSYFKVDTNGLLTADNAVIWGKIYASEGEFTGKVTATSGSFDGKITASSGKIGGFTINAADLTSSENSSGEYSRLASTSAYWVHTYGSRLVKTSISGSNINMCYVSPKTGDFNFDIYPDSITIGKSTGSSTFNTVFSFDNTDGLYTTYKGKFGTGCYVSNSKSGYEIVLHSSDGGNRGLYDNTNSNWLIYKDTSGYVHIPTRLYADQGKTFLNPSMSTSTGTTYLIIDTSTGEVIRHVSSSKRFKKDITTDITCCNPESLYDVEVVQYKYKEDYLGENDNRFNKDVIGFIAEQMDEVFPQAVDYEGDGKTPLDWNEKFIIPAMLKLIQEQKQQIDSLESRLTAIENRIKESD